MRGNEKTGESHSTVVYVGLVINKFLFFSILLINHYFISSHFLVTAMALTDDSTTSSTNSGGIASTLTALNSASSNM